MLTWGFADAIYPSLVPELSRQSYWWMAVAATIGLFFSIMSRELIQILVANRLKMLIGGITLFVFGGTFETQPAPTTGGKAEVLIAAAGALASATLGALLLVGLFATADKDPALCRRCGLLPRQPELPPKPLLARLPRGTSSSMERCHFHGP